MFIIGTLVKIDSYKNLVLQIDEKTYKQLTSQKVNTWTFTPDDVEEAKTRYFCRVNLDKYDKRRIEKKFEPLIKKLVSVRGSRKSYDFKTPEGEHKAGVYFSLEAIRERVVPKKVEKEPEEEEEVTY